MFVKTKPYFWSRSYSKQSLLWPLLRDKTYTTVYFPEILHSSRRNSARSFQSFFDQSSRVLSLVFPRNWIFHEHRHILGYHTPLIQVWAYSTSEKKILKIPKWWAVFNFRMMKTLITILRLETRAAKLRSQTLRFAIS